MNAIALNSSMFNGARVIGPAIAGILVVAIGEGWCFFANAVSYIAVIAGLLMMRVTACKRLVNIGFPTGGYHRRIPLGRHTGPIRALLSVAGPREPGGHALRRAHAHIRRSHPARAAPRDSAS